MYKDGYSYYVTRFLSYKNEIFYHFVVGTLKYNIIDENRCEYERCYEKGTFKYNFNLISKNKITKFRKDYVDINTCFLCHKLNINCRRHDKFNYKSHNKTKTHQKTIKTYCDILEDETGLNCDVVNHIMSYL